MARSRKKRYKRTIVGVGRRGTFRMTTTIANLRRHDLGDVTPAALIKEGQSAVSFLRSGMDALLNAQYDQAVDLFFKSAAIACNVTFTARTHDVPVPEELVRRMCMVSDRATCGIKKVMVAIATRRILDHESMMHGLAGRLASMTQKVRKLSILS